MTFRTRASSIASIQSAAAIKLLDRTADDFLRPPWDTLDDVVGGMPEGSIWFVGGFSGDGKTTFLTSAVDRWYETGKRIYYLGTESRPNVLKTHWACKRVGVDAGDVLSGRALLWPDWQMRKLELAAVIRGLDEGETAAQVHFSPTEFIDASELASAFKNAKEFGADILLLDHIDHVQGDKNPFETSRDVCMTLLHEAQRTNIRALVATQFNNESLKGNRLGRYRPPQPTHVYMGGHKRQIADGMLGLYRPVKKGLDPDTIKQFQRGELEPMDVCEPNTMGVVCMKHRLYGNHEGRRVMLKVERGRVIEPPIHQDGTWNV